MSSYYQENISLEQAMYMELPNNTRVWDVPGFQVKGKDIPENAVINRIFVESHLTGNTSVEAMFTVEGELGIFTASIAVYPEFDLEKLQKEFPNLFKLTGSLCAFDK